MCEAESDESPAAEDQPRDDEHHRLSRLVEGRADTAPYPIRRTATMSSNCRSAHSFASG